MKFAQFVSIIKTAYKGKYALCGAMLIVSMIGTALRFAYVSIFLEDENNLPSYMMMLDFAAEYFMYTLHYKMYNFVYMMFREKMTNEFEMLAILSASYPYDGKGRGYLRDATHNNDTAATLLLPFEILWYVTTVIFFYPISLVSVLHLLLQMVIFITCNIIVEGRKHFDPCCEDHYEDDEKDVDAIRNVTADLPFLIVNGGHMKEEESVVKKFMKGLISNSATLAMSGVLGSAIKYAVGLNKADIMRYGCCPSAHIAASLSSTYIYWYCFEAFWFHYTTMQKRTRCPMDDPVDTMKKLTPDPKSDAPHRPKNDMYIQGKVAVKFRKHMFVEGHEEETICFNVEIKYTSGIHYIFAGNGAGKSTFLRCLFVDPNVKYIGKKRNTVWWLNNICYEQQKNPSLPSKKNISERIKKNPEMAEILNIGLDKLSGGQQRKTNFFMSMTSGRRIIIFDEPFTEVDDAGKEAIIQVLTTEIFLKEKCIIIVDNTDFLNMPEDRPIGWPQNIARQI